MITWVIDEHIQKHNSKNLYDIVRSFGYNCIVKSYRPFADDNKVTEISETDCAIVYGTVNFVRSNRHIFGNYLDSKAYSMVGYRSKYFDTRWLNDGVFTTWIDLIKNYNKYCEMLGSTNLFVRPNSGEKTFTGLVLSGDNIQHEINSTQQLTGVLNDTLVFVSLAKKIDSEYRFFIVNKEVVGESTYMVNHIHDERPVVPSSARDFALDFASKTDEPLVLDVGRVGDDFGAIEINCINSSGFYSCNVDNIVHSLSQYVNHKWAEVFSSDI